MLVGGIPITLVRKRIRYMHLYVKPPDGRVLVTAPKSSSDKNVAEFVQENTEWIARNREKVCCRARIAQLEYVSGETHYLWGKPLALRVVEVAEWGGVILSGSELLMFVPETSTAKDRKAFLAEWYRDQLAAAIAEDMPVFERLTGLKCSSWQIRDMIRLWGSCSPRRASIRLNLQLVKRERVALRYIILHELCHLKIRGHGKDFKAMLDRYMPDWRDVRKSLNEVSLP